MTKEKPKIEEMVNRLKRVLSYYSTHSIIYEAGKMLKKGSKEAEEQLRQFLDEDIEDKFLAFCWLHEELLKKRDLEKKTIKKMKSKEKMLKRIFN